MPIDNPSEFVGHGLDSQFDGQYAGAKLWAALEAGRIEPGDVAALCDRIREEFDPGRAERVLDGIGEAWFKCELLKARLEALGIRDRTA